MLQDATDRALIALLRANARASTADLARQLGIARTTVVARLQRLERSGVIVGYTVRLGQDEERPPGERLGRRRPQPEEHLAHQPASDGNGPRLQVGDARRVGQQVVPVEPHERVEVEEQAQQEAGRRGDEPRGRLPRPRRADTHPRP